MAKKASGKDTANELSLKVRLTPEEHKDVRVAAAEMEKSISEFLKHAVVTQARLTVAEYLKRGASKAGSKPGSREG
jgi:uncharacterized protein (DUF1778 family)